MKILVAEDDTHTRNGLMDIFNNEGYETVAASTGKEALALYVKESPDIVCLDIMMPDINGYDVCKEIRRDDTNIPILFISAKSEEIDKVLGLEIGADDYIVKPFGVKEVVARIRAVTRRVTHGREETTSESFVMGDLKIVPKELRAYRKKTIIEISKRDLKILVLLFKNKGKVLDRDTIFDVCWGLDYMPNSRSLDQHVSQLRKRIEKDPQYPRIIHTVHAAGYRYDG
ncbi:response regulator transcription factor [PVC group bacterium]|nr:response regulator transcription factor [PVC group bacterium]